MIVLLGIDPIILKVHWTPGRHAKDMVKVLFNGFKEAMSKLGRKAIEKNFLIAPFGFPPTSEYTKELISKIQIHMEEKGINILTLLTDEDVQANKSKIDAYLSSNHQGALISGYPYIQGLEFNTVLIFIDDSVRVQENKTVPISTSFANMALRAKINLAVISIHKEKPITFCHPELD